MKVEFIQTMSRFNNGRLEIYKAGKQYDLLSQDGNDLAKTKIVRIIAELDPAPITADRPAAPIKARRNRATELLTK